MDRVPAALAVDVERQAGAAGRRWLAALPVLVDDLLVRWDLVADPPPTGGPVRHGANALVVPVRHRDGPAVLKVTWDVASAAGEVLALRTWDGRGAVRLLETAPDDGALLLERLDASRSLHALPLTDAVPAVAGVLRRLCGVRAPDGVPRAADLAASVAASLEGRARAAGNPLDGDVLDDVRSAAADLTADDATDLVHADLHWGNVLAGTREPWVAVDPRPRAGRPELSLPELLWTRADELPDAGAVRDLLADLVAAAGLDAAVARAWVVVRCADYLLWGLEHGLSEDPPRCARILAAVR